MRGLNKREGGLLMLCFGVTFVMANVFVGRMIFKSLGGGRTEIRQLQDELAENRMYLEEKDLWDRRRAWIDANIPPPMGSTLNAQGELAQSLQEELLDRKIRIERQNLQEPVSGANYEEVAVYLRVRGDAAKINEWLSTLQSPEKFQVIKNLTLELDTKAKETEPQATCSLTVARWYTPKGQGTIPVPEPMESEPQPESMPEPEPVAPEPTAPVEGFEDAPTPPLPVDPENTETPKEEEKSGEGKGSGKKVELTER